MFEYKTNGTCSTGISFDIVEGAVHNVAFTSGCNGNLKAVAALVEGMKTGDLIARLKGMRCGQRETSCPDQLAKAVELACAP